MRRPRALTFARWIAADQAPTTARVFVNRVWQAYFGTGLVGTSEDFGTQCEAPSHPELLDWLACEFMEHGWSVKYLQRLIVNSATYQQNSRVNAGCIRTRSLQPVARRGPRFRVEGEIVRDVALAASGLLNPKVGGRSVMPPAPAYLFQPPASYAPFPWKGRRRRGKISARSVYLPPPFDSVIRSSRPLMFECGHFRACAGLRSNSPLQALVSLNESIFVECAQALARQTLEAGGKTDAERVTYAFRRALSPPADAEQEKNETSGSAGETAGPSGGRLVEPSRDRDHG
jgi:hypothetical protein